MTSTGTPSWWQGDRLDGIGVSPCGRWLLAAFTTPTAPAVSWHAVRSVDDSEPTWRRVGTAGDAAHGAMFLSDGEHIVAWRTGRAEPELVLYPSHRPGRAVRRVARPPDGATVLKAWGASPSLACLGVDAEGTRRVFAWVDGLDRAPSAVTPARQRVGDFAFAPNSRRFAWTHQNPWRVGQPPPTPLLFLDEVGGTGPVRVEVPAAPLGYLAWDVSGRHLAWLARPDGELLAHPELWVLDIVAAEASRLLSEADGWVTSWDWTHREGRLIAAVEAGLTSSLHRLDVDGTRERLDRADAVWRAPSCARAAEGFVALAQDVHRAPRAVWRSPQAAPRVVTETHLAADAAALRPASVWTWLGRDGLELEGLWMTPEGEAPHPVVVWLHGGPAEHVGRGFSVLFQGLVEAGFAVFAPNVRGSTGRGDGFLRALEGRLATEDVEDVERGVRSLIRAGEVHRRRVGLFGWSYGGSLALMTAAGRPGSALSRQALRWSTGCRSSARARGLTSRRLGLARSRGRCRSVTMRLHRRVGWRMCRRPCCCCTARTTTASRSVSRGWPSICSAPAVFRPIFGCFRVRGTCSARIGRAPRCSIGWWNGCART